MEKQCFGKKKPYQRMWQIQLQNHYFFTSQIPIVVTQFKSNQLQVKQLITILLSANAKAITWYPAKQQA
jgi:hypothetical protein